MITVKITDPTKFLDDTPDNHRNPNEYYAEYEKIRTKRKVSGW